MAEHDGEMIAKRAIEDQGYIVHNANLIFRSCCPNIDLIVYGKRRAIYVQVKSSSQIASVCIDGSPWTEARLNGHDPIFNKVKDTFQAELIVIVDRASDDQIYIARPDELERGLRKAALRFADKPKRDGTKRSVRFRKHLSRAALRRWRDQWPLMADL